MNTCEHFRRSATVSQQSGCLRPSDPTTYQVHYYSPWRYFMHMHFRFYIISIWWEAWPCHHVNWAVAVFDAILSHARWTCSNEIPTAVTPSWITSKPRRCTTRQCELPSVDLHTHGHSTGENLSLSPGLYICNIWSREPRSRQIFSNHLYTLANICVLWSSNFSFACKP